MTRANGFTRQGILTSLKSNGMMTAEELSQELQISPVAARQHLASLEAENIIAISVERRGLGRPSHRYKLTEIGDETFTRRYEELSTTLVEELRVWQGEEAVDTLFERRADRQLHTLLGRMKDKSLAGRVQEVARFQSEQGYMAEAVPGEEPDEFRLVQYNCAVCAIARDYGRFTCKYELDLLEQALGCAEVVRETYIMDGDHTCSYRIRAKKGMSTDSSGAEVSFPEAITDQILSEKTVVEQLLVKKKLAAALPVEEPQTA